MAVNQLHIIYNSRITGTVKAPSGGQYVMLDGKQVYAGGSKILTSDDSKDGQINLIRVR